MMHTQGEADLPTDEFLGDRARIGQGPGKAIELVTASVSPARHGPVRRGSPARRDGAGEAMVDVSSRRRIDIDRAHMASGNSEVRVMVSAWRVSLDGSVRQALAFRVARVTIGGKGAYVATGGRYPSRSGS